MRSKIAILLSLILVVIGFAGCKTVVYDRQGGNPDLAYLQFTSSGSYAGKEVEVVLDDDTSFTAKVAKARKASIKPNLYTIKPGRRIVRVYSHGNLISEQEIFVSQQNTRVIQL